MSNRLQYLDIAKGILIILVILGHIGWACNEEVGTNLLVQSHIMNHVWAFFAPCYMSAFFIITGYCSSFDKQFFEFLKKSFMTLIVPAIIIGCIISILENRSFTSIINIIINLGNNWFLSAMFLGRIIYRVHNKYISNIYVRLAVLMLLSWFGLWINEKNICGNYLALHQTLIFAVFLGIGALAKKKDIFENKTSLMLFAFLFIMIKIWSVLSHSLLPAVCQVIEASSSQAPLFIVEGICGASLIVLISKIITKVKGISVVEYLGRNSLLIYLTHQAFIFVFIHLFGVYILSYCESWGIGTLLWCGLFFISIIPCIFVIWIVNTKYLRWVIGK